MPLEKPARTPPEIRRRRAELEGQLKSLESENSRRLAEVSEGDKIPSDAEWGELDGYTAKILDMRKLVQKHNEDLESAERWELVDQRLGEGEGRGRSNPGELMPHNDPTNTRNGRHQYSVLKGLRAFANGQRLSGIEAEVQTEMDKIPRAPGSQRSLYGPGLSIPHDLPIDVRASMRHARRSGVGPQAMRAMADTRRALEAEYRASVFDTGAGAGSIPTILDTTIIDILRARMVTYNMGAKAMTGMQGLFAIPRQSQASTFYMVGQGTSVAASNQKIDQVPFSPHTGGVNTQYTRQLLEQTNQEAEMFVREDQAAVVARGVETAALNGQGSAGYPLGLLQNQLIGVYPLGTNGAAPTWTMIVSMESYVAYYNADVGSLGYITDALTRGTFKLTVKVASSTFPIYLWNTEAPDFPVNGYPVGVTNLLPQNLTKGTGTFLHSMIFGNWEDLVYAYWSGMDTIVDPYTSAAQGAVNIITLQDFDVNVRHPESFANCVDIISSITAPIT